MLMNVGLTSSNKIINIITCLTGAYNSQDRQIFVLEINYSGVKKVDMIVGVVQMLTCNT